MADEVVATLRAAGCVFAEEEADLLRERAADSTDLARMVALRVVGEPLEWIVGWAEFDGLRVGIAPGVFIPRHRSELLVDVAAGLTRPEATVVDLCCGTGALGLALARRVPGIRLYAADLDPVAVSCARSNLADVGQVTTGDLWNALPRHLIGQVDLALANAPYVPTAAIELLPPEFRDHEPRSALDGGPDGLTLHRRIAADSLEWLAPGGRLLIEVGQEQVADAVRMFDDVGLTAVVRHDEDFGGAVLVGHAEVGPSGLLS